MTATSSVRARVLVDTFDPASADELFEPPWEHLEPGRDVTAATDRHPEVQCLARSARTPRRPGAIRRVASGASRRCASLTRESAGGSPKYSPTMRFTPAASNASSRSNISLGESGTYPVPPAMRNAPVSHRQPVRVGVHRIEPGRIGLLGRTESFERVPAAVDAVAQSGAPLGREQSSHDERSVVLHRRPDQHVRQLGPRRLPGSLFAFEESGTSSVAACGGGVRSTRPMPRGGAERGSARSAGPQLLRFAAESSSIASRARPARRELLSPRPEVDSGVALCAVDSFTRRLSPLGPPRSSR